MEKTKYEIIADKCPCNLKESELREYNKIWQKRRLHRYVNYQISQIKGERSFDDVFSLFDEKMLRSDDPEIYRLIRLAEDGIFERHQFVDAKPNLTQSGYNRWYNNAMKNTFFHTILAKDIFSVSDYNGTSYTGDLVSLVKRHSSEELSFKMSSGYSINQILRSLGHIDPFLMFNLIFQDVSIEKINDVDFVVGTFESENGQLKKFASNFREKDLYTLSDDGELKKFMNMYEFMFKHYRKPIFEVINSVNNAVDYFLCPGEGLGSYSYDRDISEGVEEITKSQTYKKVKENYIRPFNKLY